MVSTASSNWRPARPSASAIPTSSRVSNALLERDSLPDDAGTYQPGDLVEFPAPDGSRFAGVLKEQDETGALFDFNHPLAGKAVRFEVKLLGVL